MTHRWLTRRQREAKKSPALRVLLLVEPLEQRNLLSGLVFVPSPQVSSGFLRSAAAISANDIWTVGSNSISNGAQTLAEHFDGTSWSVVSTPSPTSNSGFNGVGAAASNDVWAVGSGGTNNATLIEHWNGANWSEVPSPMMPTGSDLKAVTAPASNNAWAIGTNSQSANALVEHWDGTSWSVVSSPAFTGETILSLGGNISADSTTDVWVVGVQGNTSEGAPFNGGASLHWNGQTWSVISGPTFAQADTAISPTNVWGAGFRGEFFHNPDRTVDVPVVEHWDGTSWSIIPSPNPNGKNPLHGSRLNGIAAISAKDIWAVGANEGSTLTEHWDGTRWRVINSPNPGQDNSLSGVTALSDGTVAAVGSQFSSGTGTTPLILQNGASAPKTATRAATSTPVVLAMRDAAPATNVGAPTAPSNTTTQAPTDAVSLDQFFAAAGNAKQLLALARHRLVGHELATNGDPDLLMGSIWSWDRA